MFYWRIKAVASRTTTVWHEYRFSVTGYAFYCQLPLRCIIASLLLLKKRSHKIYTTRLCNFFAAAQHNMPPIFAPMLHCLRYILSICYSLIDPFIDALVSPFRAIWTRHVRNVLRFPTRAYHYRTPNCSSASHGCSSANSNEIAFLLTNMHKAGKQHSCMDGYLPRLKVQQHQSTQRTDDAIDLRKRD